MRSLKLPNHGYLAAQHLCLYEKKNFFPVTARPKLVAWLLVDSPACCVCCSLVEYHCHSHNNTCAILSQHIPFQDTTRKSSQDEPSSATYRSQTSREIEVHEGII